jgi:hypothetical protein
LFGVGIRSSRLRLFLWLDFVSATTTASLALVVSGFLWLLWFNVFVLFILELLVVFVFLFMLFSGIGW